MYAHHLRCDDLPLRGLQPLGRFNTPRRYARFLDHAYKLIFLRRVGGGCIFLHRLLARTLRRDERCQGRVGIMTHRHGCATVLFPSAQRGAHAAGPWIKKGTVKNPHLRLPYPTACSHGLTASPGGATTQTEKSTQVHTSNPSSTGGRPSPCGGHYVPCHTALPGYRGPRPNPLPAPGQTTAPCSKNLEETTFFQPNSLPSTLARLAFVPYSVQPFAATARPQPRAKALPTKAPPWPPGAFPKSLACAGTLTSRR